MSKYKYEKYYSIISEMKNNNNTNKEILKAIGDDNLTIDKLHKIIYRLNLGSKKYNEKYRKIDSKAIELIKSGKSHRQTAKILKIDQQSMSLRLRIFFNIIPLADGKKEVVNMFEEIDTEEKAYWLGMMYADGYVHDDGIELTLKDKEHIEKFKKFLYSKHKVSEKKVKTDSGIKTYYRLNIKDRDIVKSLIRLGCVKAKSLILKFPTEDQVPYNMLKHFIRGYVDGDGSIGYGSGKNPQASIEIIGTINFINGYRKYLLNKLNVITTETVGNTGNNFNKKIGGNIKAKKVIKHLYEDSTIYLDRKYNRYLKICRPK